MIDKNKIVELYRKCATELPKDILEKIKYAAAKETDAKAKEILNTIIENAELAKKESKPICQDTGTPIFYVEYSKDYSEEKLKKIIEQATHEATETIPLRPNAVDPITNENMGNKPIIHFKQAKKLKIDLLMKGGGSENVSCVYSLPDKELKANRGINGIKKCALDAVFKAQGKGCPPYIIGIALAGTIEEAAYLSKKQLLRKLNEQKTEFYELENEILDDINELGIGPMGLGGKTTAIGVKISKTYRHPATFFVGISFGCWALRRQAYE